MGIAIENAYEPLPAWVSQILHLEPLYAIVKRPCDYDNETAVQRHDQTPYLEFFLNHHLQQFDNF